MDAFQVEVNRYELKDGTFNGIALNSGAVSEYENKLQNLFQSCFNEISKHLKTLSDESEILKFIALKKREFKEIWDKQTEIGRRFAFDKPPLSVEDWMEQWDIDEETAILKKEKSVCIHNMYSLQMTYVEKSLLELMTLHRKYSNDLLKELKRVEFEIVGYNDVPFDDIFQDRPKYLVWHNRLFDGYFDELSRIIITKCDLKDIDALLGIGMETLKQNKKELSEKWKLLTKTNNNLQKAASSNKNEDDRQKQYKIVCCETLYKRQHKFINMALKKLKKMRKGYLSIATTPSIDILKTYFVPSFKGAGNRNYNCFNRMIEDIRNMQARTGTRKMIAKVALMIYESDKMIERRKPKTFTLWLKLFYEYVGCKYVKYDPNKLRTPSKTLTDRFKYLY